jgi:hypothetical protein
MTRSFEARRAERHARPRGPFGSVYDDAGGLGLGPGLTVLMGLPPTPSAMAFKIPP